ncbi:MAG: hypothetical protein D6800_01775, partial [Candidatus Zixiibacteriota bacterium]
RQDEVIALVRDIEAHANATGAGEIVRLATATREKAEMNLNDTYEILDALQFQDITSQQIDYAAALLEDIEQKLKSILHVVGVSAPLDISTGTKKERAFDPHADLKDKKQRQADIDSLFARKDT